MWSPTTTLLNLKIEANAIVVNDLLMKMVLICSISINQVLIIVTVQAIPQENLNFICQIYIPKIYSKAIKLGWPT